jgi:type VI secretion system protein ImpF
VTAPRAALDRQVQPSLLDRLIDLDPRTGIEPPPTRAESVEQYIAGVRRDLEWLLNTRRPPLTVPDGCEALERSVFTYGVPDTTPLGRDDAGARRRLQAWIEEAIATFEPRLKDVRVELGEGSVEGLRRVRFVVAGELQLHPRPQQVTFDAVVDGAGTYAVEGGAGG